MCELMDRVFRENRLLKVRNVIICIILLMDAAIFWVNTNKDTLYLRDRVQRHLSVLPR